MVDSGKFNEKDYQEEEEELGSENGRFEAWVQEQKAQAARFSAKRKRLGGAYGEQKERLISLISRLSMRRTSLDDCSSLSFRIISPQTANHIVIFRDSSLPGRGVRDHGIPS